MVPLVHRVHYAYPASYREHTLCAGVKWNHSQFRFVLSLNINYALSFALGLHVSGVECGIGHGRWCVHGTEC